MKRHGTLISTAVLGAIILLGPQMANASSIEYLTNGDLETWSNYPGTNPNQVRPDGWSFENPTVTNSVRTRTEGLTDDSDYALAFMKSMTHNAGVYQDGIDASPMATFDYLLAVSQPTTGGRVYHWLDYGTYNQPGFWRVDWQIMDNGDFRIRNSFKMSGFQFSVDANGDYDFNDAGDTKNVYRLRVEFNNDGVNSSYNVYLSDPNVLDGTFANQWLGETNYMTTGNPSGWQPDTGPDRFFLYGANQGTATTHLEVLDNVSIMVPQIVPEPTALGLLLLGGLAILNRRRRLVS